MSPSPSKPPSSSLPATFPHPTLDMVLPPTASSSNVAGAWLCYEANARCNKITGQPGLLAGP